MVSAVHSAEIKSSEGEQPSFIKQQSSLEHTGAYCFYQ